MLNEKKLKKKMSKRKCCLVLFLTFKLFIHLAEIYT